MRRSTLTRQRLVALFLVGLFLFFSPLVLLFDHSFAPFGIPILYLYLFGVWASLIAASAGILGLDAE